MRGAILLTALVALAPACKKHNRTGPAARASASASSAGAARAAPAEWHPPVPSGPVLAILAGKGVGPIRIGATVATIERQMQKKCDVKTDKMCRYIDRAVEFDLENGEVKTIRVERPGRPAGKDQSGNERHYGIFHGAIPRPACCRGRCSGCSALPRRSRSATAAGRTTPSKSPTTTA
jgi:hypothetical protein